jgi:protein-tyrosine-phosphatase
LLMKKLNILFVCKYNRFRSKVAESYFKRTKRNRRIKVMSAGLIRGKYPLDKEEVRVAKQFKIKLKGEPRAMNYELLRDQDRIIIVADNVPKSIFDWESLVGKVEVWKIEDIGNNASEEEIRKVIKQIIFNVDRLNAELMNERKKRKR